MPTQTAFLLGWLLGASSLLFALIAGAAWWQHRRAVPSKARRRAERAQWAEHAVAVADRAQQSADRVAAAQADLLRAEQERADAWQELEQATAAHDEAARRYEEARQRSGEARPSEPSGQQEVTQAAFAAYRRGDLSQEQLWRVWSWGSGWGPELAERERELLALRAALREARVRYRAAAGRERTAAAEVEVADVEARALAEEVATATEEAGWHDDPYEQRSQQPG